MFNKFLINSCKYLTIFLMSYTILLAGPFETERREPQIDYFNIPRSFRASFSFAAGMGAETNEMADLIDRPKIATLSAGGGIGGNISIGYCFSPYISTSIEIGAQKSFLSERNVKNADGSFGRNYLLGTARYNIPVLKNASINIGGGGGYYLGGNVDYEYQPIDEETGEIISSEPTAHTEISYDNTIGTHFITEFEYFPNSSFYGKAYFSWCLGLKYYNVSYEWNSAFVNGTEIPVAGDLETIDGSGFDIYLSIIMHM